METARQIPVKTRIAIRKALKFALAYKHRLGEWKEWCPEAMAWKATCLDCGEYIHTEYDWFEHSEHFDHTCAARRRRKWVVRK